MVVKLYGIIPIRLLNRIKVKSVNIKGKYFMNNKNGQNAIPLALQFTIYSGKWGNQLIPRVSDERIQEIRENIRIHKIARANIPKESKHIRFNYLKYSQMKKRIEGMISGINQYVSNPQSLLKDFYIRQKTLFVARLNFLENL